MGATACHAQHTTLNWGLGGTIRGHPQVLRLYIRHVTLHARGLAGLHVASAAFGDCDLGPLPRSSALPTCVQQISGTFDY